MTQKTAVELPKGTKSETAPEFNANVEAQYTEITHQLADVQKKLDRIENHANEGTGLFGLNDALWHGYANEYAQEKMEIAKFVSTNLIGSNQRVFIQASTTAVHLAEQIAKNQRINSSLFYTNSVPFPLILLRSNASNFVYTFCGPFYDPACGGWLFNDPKTSAELHELFTRTKDALTHGFLAPIAVTPDSLYYARSDTAVIARIVLENAQNVVITAPSARIFPNEDALPQGKSWTHATGDSWKKRTLLVAGGDPKVRSVLEQFVAAGYEVHYQAQPNGKWELVGSSKP